MSKQRKISFKECLALMRKNDPQLAEDGFHFLRPQAKEHINKLIKSFENEESYSIRCWLLELIGEARSCKAFPILSQQALSSDESLRIWGTRGLKLLDTKDARRFLYKIQ